MAVDGKQDGKKDGKPQAPRGMRMRCRLYAKATFTGFRRGQRIQYPNVALLNIEGTENRQDASWYVGKRCAFIYHGKTKKRLPGTTKPTTKRIVWGKVSRPHGKGGAVRARFTKNLNPAWMGYRVRIMLYPCNNL